MESITKDKESHINDDTVYHGSSIKMDIIKGNYTENKRFGYDGVFVTPFKFIASHYCVPKIVMQNVMENKLKVKISDMRVYLRLKPNSYSDKRLLKDYGLNRTFYLCCFDKDGNVIKYKDFENHFIGYIHYIHYSDYKNKSFQDNDSRYEFYIKGDVKPYKVEKVIYNYKIKFWNGKRK